MMLSPCYVFGLEFAHKLKELVDRVRTIRSTTQKDGKLLFQQAPKSSGITVSDLGEVEARAPEREIGSSNRAGGLNGTNSKLHVCKSFNNELQKYSCLPDCVHGVNNLQLTDLPQTGRLCYYLSKWSIITQDRWVLHTVWGYLIDFVLEPHQQFPPNPPHYSSEQTSLIHKELIKLLKKQAIQQLKYPVEAGYLSNIFLVPK